MTQHDEPPSSSSSTYGAVLINPSSLDASRPFNPALGNASSASLVSAPVPHRPPRLSYPVPLVFAAILDTSYSAYHVWKSKDNGGIPPSALMLGLTGMRAGVLALICGCSKRWRSRGGWVAAASGLSVGAAIWKDCVDQLTGANSDRKAEESVYLYTTILIAASEYLLFLILLRLSPPTYRARPLSLLHPSSADQQAVPFAYTSQDAMITPRSTRQRRFSSLASSPFSAHPRAYHRSRLSTNTFNDFHSAGPSRGMALASGNDLLSAELYANAHPSDPSNPYSSPRSGSHSGEGEESVSDECESDYDYDYDCDSASSVSESSIIDLPPPLEPHRIIPPSLSMRSNLSHALDSSPLLAPIARRTRSVQMLARSFGSVMQGEMAEEAMSRMRGQGQGDAEGQARPGMGGGDVSDYGTFEAGSASDQVPGTA